MFYIALWLFRYVIDQKNNRRRRKRKKTMAKFSTKRALLASVVSLLLCASMLVGSTLAWFTDVASTGVNSIVSGKFDVALMMKDKDDNWVSAEGQTLDFIKAENADPDEPILWEPGCVYRLPAIRVDNNGNLALKYELVITGINGDHKLNDVIEWYIIAGDKDPIPMAEYADFKGNLKAYEKSVEMIIEGRMKPDATNEYQNLSMSGISITVVATQDAVEYDSNDNQYDASAEWPIVFAANEAALTMALTQKSETKVVLNGNVTLSGVTNVVGEKLIDLNGKTLTVTEDRAIDINEANVTLTNGTVNYAGTDAPIIVRSGTELVLDDVIINVENTMTGSTYGNAAGIIVNQGSGSVVTMNSGEININGSNGGSGVYLAYAEGGNHTFNFNGGTINVETGTYGVGIECLSTNTLNLNGGVINMKDASKGWAFNVGQSQGQPTVVTGNGKTVVNLYSAANIAYETGDAAEFKGVAFVKNTVIATVSNAEELTNALTNAKPGDAIAINDNAVVLGNNLPAGVSILGNGAVNSVVTVPANAAGDRTTGLQIKDGGTIISGVTLAGNNSLSSDEYASVAAVKVGNTTFDGVAISATGRTSAIVIDSFNEGVVTISNSTLSSGFKTVHIADGANGKVVIDKTEITGVYTFNVNSKTSPDLVIDVTNSKLHGWTSYGKIAGVNFTNTEFSKGDSAYNYLRAYAPTTFTSCDFDADFRLHGMEATTITLDDCSWNGVKLTAENIKGMLDIDDNLKACNVTVDGVAVVW